MMGVIIGETLEQKRFFDQILAGRDDLLGRRSNGPGSPGTGDGVLARQVARIGQPLPFGYWLGYCD